MHRQRSHDPCAAYAALPSSVLEAGTARVLEQGLAVLGEDPEGGEKGMPPGTMSWPGDTSIPRPPL
jgi:hypothetical protein